MSAGRCDPGLYLAACAVFKDEARYLPEWIEFHRLVGVEHFYLYDNGSAEPPSAVLRPWLDAGLVTLVPWPMPYYPHGQKAAYVDCLERARGVVRWVAFVDLDEFLFSPDGSSLPEVLSEFEQHPGVVVNWQIYGSSGHAVCPPGLVIESFTRRAPTQWARNRRTKTIADPTRARYPENPHLFRYEGDALAVNERHEPVRIVHRAGRSLAGRRLLARLGVNVDPIAGRVSSSRTVSVERLRINHYAVRSRAEFAEKAARVGGAPQWETKAAFYYAMHDRNDVHDPVLAPYAPVVATRIAEMRRGAS